MDTIRGNRRWHTATKSGANGTNCVRASWQNEDGTPASDVLVEDSKHPGVNVLGLTPSVWGAFLTEVKTGRFNL